MTDLHHRSTLDDAFCEWLLSDHPDAKAERDWRRGTLCGSCASPPPRSPRGPTGSAPTLSSTRRWPATWPAPSARSHRRLPSERRSRKPNRTTPTLPGSAPTSSRTCGGSPGLPLPRPSHRHLGGQLPAAARARAGGVVMTPEQAIEAAEQVEAETAYRLQLARDAYEAGHADGYRAGYRQADADQAARWNQAARAIDGPARAELEEGRWGPGGRAHFADPRPGNSPAGAPSPSQKPDPK